MPANMVRHNEENKHLWAVKSLLSGPMKVSYECI